MKPAVIATCAALFLTSQATAASNLLFIMDSSNSMWGQLNGVAKITTAKTALGRLIGDLPDDTRVGLMAYGHREKGNCDDVQLLTPVAAGAADDVVTKLSALTPKGKTPIAASLTKSAAAFEGLDGAKSVVLISDGIETCGGDACAAAGKLSAEGIDVRVHVVGFDLSPAERAELECIAKEGKGQYFAANSTEGFTAAVTEAVEVARAEPAPEPEPEIVVAQATTTPPAISRETIWTEEFDGFDLVEPWTVTNPNPDNYVVEEGELLLLVAAPNDFNNPEAENLIVRNEKLPRGDWDISATLRAEFRTGTDTFNFGLRKDGANYLQALLFSSAGYCHSIVIRLQKVANGTSTNFDRSVYESCGDTTGFATMLDALASGGATVTLSKRGRSYFASASVDGYNGADGKPTVWTTDRLTSLRSPGKLTLGISKWNADSAGEVLVFVGRIEAVAVEGAE